MRFAWLWSGVGGCFLFGGGLDAESWPEEAARATCDFSEACAKAAFFKTYEDRQDCRADNEATLAQDAAAAIADGCVFDEILADACLDALGSSCEDAGRVGQDLLDPCREVWNCDDVEPAPTTDSGF
ncbi:MAG: hypothetical protein AAF211_11395 [Myxococcota bacterium]